MPLYTYFEFHMKHAWVTVHGAGKRVEEAISAGILSYGICFIKLNGLNYYVEYVAMSNVMK